MASRTDQLLEEVVKLLKSIDRKLDALNTSVQYVDEGNVESHLSTIESDVRLLVDGLLYEEE